MSRLLCAIGVLLAATGSVHAQDVSGGKATYEQQCAPCHASGILGSPRTGDAAAWSPRAATGMNTLYANAIKGKGGMPARGGNAALSDAQVIAAVNYILNLSGSSAALAKREPDAAKASPAADAGKGRSVYQSACAACHGTGASGAPKLGDAAAWGPRLNAGTGALHASALKGKGAMPPKGGNAALPDADVRAAVDFMVSQSRTSAATPAIASPAAPAAPAAAAPPAAQTADAGKGRAVYQSSCAACHGTGAAGAPKLGDGAAWSARLATGPGALQANALKGKGAMPPKGGNASLPDADVRAAVDYMMAQVRPGAAPAVANAPAAVPAEPTVDAGKGRTVYQSACAACHTTGVAGAPKLGDSTAWAPRIGTGLATLHANALKGKGAMPPKGGNASLADADVRAAVEFIVAQARSGTVAAAPASAASAPAAAPSPPAPAAVTVAPAPPMVQAANDPNAFNRLMAPASKRNAAPADDGIHDPASPGTMLLQAPLASFTTLPRSNNGNYVDWVAALGRKQIQPRWDARDPKADPTVMDLNIIREVKGSMPDVVFPHKQHTEWLDCSNCHPAIFIPQKGANQISMAAIMLGQKCGACHGKVAFPVSECRLCHSRSKTTQTAGEGKR